jgi:hypothetical protein
LKIVAQTGSTIHLFNARSHLDYLSSSCLLEADRHTFASADFQQNPVAHLPRQLYRPTFRPLSSRVVCAQLSSPPNLRAWQPIAVASLQQDALVPSV